MLDKNRRVCGGRYAEGVIYFSPGLPLWATLGHRFKNRLGATERVAGERFEALGEVYGAAETIFGSAFARTPKPIYRELLWQPPKPLRGIVSSDLRPPDFVEFP